MGTESSSSSQINYPLIWQIEDERERPRISVRPLSFYYKIRSQLHLKF